MINSCGRRPCRPAIADAALARAKAGEVVLAHLTSLRARGIIARSKHRAAYSSVEIETQFGPATSHPEQRCRPASSAAASDVLAVQSGDEAGERSDRRACRRDARGEPSSSPGAMASETTGQAPRLDIGRKRAQAAGKPSCGVPPGSTTVRQALNNYLSKLEAKNARSARTTKGRVNKHIFPRLGSCQVVDLTIQRRTNRWVTGIACE
jgi:hypothetical protein